MASEMREKVVSIAGQFGYGQDDAEDIAQDVMLKLWNLHEQLNDATHLKASAAITTKRVCIDRWRTARQHTEIAHTMPLIDEDSLHDRLEYSELEHHEQHDTCCDAGHDPSQDLYLGLLFDSLGEHDNLPAVVLVRLVGSSGFQFNIYLAVVKHREHLLVF